MLSKEEFLALASAHYEQIAALEQEKSFYTYEKTFDGIWVEFGRQTLQASLSELPENPRKKKEC
jgi:hypothetical protein